MSDTWRDYLTEEEAADLGWQDIVVSEVRRQLAEAQAKRKSIINTAIQRKMRHLKKGVAIHSVA